MHLWKKKFFVDPLSKHARSTNYGYVLARLVNVGDFANTFETAVIIVIK